MPSGGALTRRLNPRPPPLGDVGDYGDHGEYVDYNGDYGDCNRDFGLPKLGILFWGPNDKDYSILGCMLGSPYFGNHKGR